MSLEQPAGERNEGLKVTLNYIKENWQTDQETPISLEFTGSSMQEISEKVTSHLVSLEMNSGTEIAKDTKIVTPEGEMTFDEFVSKY